MDNEINDLIEDIEEEFMDVMDEDELQGIVGKEIDDAVDFIDNWISPVRATATKYYRGEPFGDEEEGRSQVVSMDVRDTVQAIMPSLMRIFHGSERTVEFAPNGPEDVAAAEQATAYVNFIMNRDNDGFLVDSANGGGIFAAGCVKRPLDVSRSVKDATAAVMKAIQIVRR